jgi:hypothetical protein
MKNLLLTSVLLIYSFPLSSFAQQPSRPAVHGALGDIAEPFGILDEKDWDEVGKAVMGMRPGTPLELYDIDGNGRATVGDWVRAGRFVWGLDDAMPAGENLPTGMKIIMSPTKIIRGWPFNNLTWINRKGVSQVALAGVSSAGNILFTGPPTANRTGRATFTVPSNVPIGRCKIAVVEVNSSTVTPAIGIGGEVNIVDPVTVSVSPSDSARVEPMNDGSLLLGVFSLFDEVGQRHDYLQHVRVDVVLRLDGKEFLVHYADTLQLGGLQAVSENSGQGEFGNLMFWYPYYSLSGSAKELRLYASSRVVKDIPWAVYDRGEILVHVYRVSMYTQLPQEPGTLHIFPQATTAWKRFR